MSHRQAIAIALTIAFADASFAAQSSPSPQQIQDTLNLLIGQPVEVTLRSGERKTGTLKVVTSATVAIELPDGSMAITAPGDVVAIRRVDPSALPTAAPPTAPERTWPSADAGADTEPAPTTRPVRDEQDAPDVRPVRDAPARRRKYDAPRVSPEAATRAKRLAEVQADARFDFTAALVATGVGTAAGLGAGLASAATSASIVNGGTANRDAVVVLYGLGAVGSVSGLVATIFAIKGGIELFEAADIEEEMRAGK
jgi:hypothetical protein